MKCKFIYKLSIGSWQETYLMFTYDKKNKNKLEINNFIIIIPTFKRTILKLEKWIIFNTFVYNMSLAKNLYFLHFS